MTLQWHHIQEKLKMHRRETGQIRGKEEPTTSRRNLDEISFGYIAIFVEPSQGTE